MSRPADHRAVMASRVDAPGEESDFYPTPPWAARAMANVIRRLDPMVAAGTATAWEPACGAGHMAHGLRDVFPVVHCSDAYLYDGNAIFDFLDPEAEPPVEADWIATNPPFQDIERFIRHAWARARRGVALLMRAGVLESEGRHALLYRDCPLTVFAPFSERAPMHKGRWEADGSTATFYAVFIWLKPVLRPRRIMARVSGEYLPAVVPIAPGQRKRLTMRSDLRFAALEGPLGVEFAGRAPSGDPIGPSDLALLETVARDGGERGVTAHHPTYPGGRLATLKMFGLLEHAPEDRLGGRRFRPSAEGWDLLRDLRRAG